MTGRVRVCSLCLAIVLAGLGVVRPTKTPAQSLTQPEELKAQPSRQLTGPARVATPEEVAGLKARSAGKASHGPARALDTILSDIKAAPSDKRHALIAEYIDAAQELNDASAAFAMQALAKLWRRN
jgi:hypothetical protein